MFIPKLEAISPNQIGILAVRFEVEKMTKKVKVQANSKECLAQMHKDRNVQNGVRRKMIEIDFVKMQQPPEEIGGWESKSALNMSDEQHSLTCVLPWSLVSAGGSPLEEILLLEQVLGDEAQQIPLLAA